MTVAAKGAQIKKVRAMLAAKGAPKVRLPNGSMRHKCVCACVRVRVYVCVCVCVRVCVLAYFMSRLSVAFVLVLFVSCAPLFGCTMSDATCCLFYAACRSDNAFVEQVQNFIAHDFGLNLVPAILSQARVLYTYIYIYIFVFALQVERELSNILLMVEADGMVKASALTVRHELIAVREELAAIGNHEVQFIIVQACMMQRMYEAARV